MTLPSQILGALLAFLVAFTAQGAAVARTMPDASGQMVICTGTGPVMVYFDEQGDPTAPPHLCPDFATSMIVALNNPLFALEPKGRWECEEAMLAKTGFKAISLGAPNARDPPYFVL